MYDENFIANYINEIGTTEGASGVLEDFSIIFVNTIMDWAPGFTKKTDIQSIRAILRGAVKQIEQIEKGYE